MQRYNIFLNYSYLCKVFYKLYTNEEISHPYRKYVPYGLLLSAELTGLEPMPHHLQTLNGRSRNLSECLTA